MAKKRSIHIVPCKEGGWEVKREGRKAPLSKHRTQAAADKAARPTARRDKVELVTHDKKGRIRDKDSFGPDRCPPKDRKH